MIKKGKISKFCVPNNICRNSIMKSIQKLIELEERLVSICIASVQIHKLYNIGQFKLYESMSGTQEY